MAAVVVIYCSNPVVMLNGYWEGGKNLRVGISLCKKLFRVGLQETRATFQDVLTFIGNIKYTLFHSYKRANLQKSLFSILGYLYICFHKEENVNRNDLSL